MQGFFFFRKPILQWTNGKNASVVDLLSIKVKLSVICFYQLSQPFLNASFSASVGSTFLRIAFFLKSFTLLTSAPVKGEYTRVPEDFLEDLKRILLMRENILVATEFSITINEFCSNASF